MQARRVTLFFIAESFKQVQTIQFYQFYVCRMFNQTRLLLTLCCWMLATVAHAASLADKKVLFVNSYHAGLGSSDDQVNGASEVLKPEGVQLKVIYMDTKRNGGDAFAVAAALKAKKEIERFQPDLVMTSDDSAAKHLIAPFYKDAKLPFVFCGVNLDASVYGLPFSNVTGVVEMEPVKPMLKLLKQYAKGPRIGFIGADTLPERRNIQAHTQIFGINYTSGYLVKSFDEFKQRFLALQKEVDMIVTVSPIGIENWDLASAREFMQTQAEVPVGGTVEWVSQYSLITLSGVLKEQGLIAGEMAKRILKGEKPSAIPVAENTDGKLFINMTIANRLGVTFDSKLLRTATLVR